MTEAETLNSGETGFDRVLAFTIPSRHARGRVVRLGPALSTILAAHAYPPVLRQLLAEALVLTALLGSLLKDEGSQLTMQAQTSGSAVDLLACDYRAGELRGYLRHDSEAAALIQQGALLAEMFGQGYLAITFDLASSGQRYQGIVPLEGHSLAQACEAYFAQSEQVPTLIRVAISGDEGLAVAGGLLVQHLAEGEDGRERLHVRLDHPEWEHVAILAGSVGADELVGVTLPLEHLLWRLFHEEQEVRVEPGAMIQRGCRCTLEHYAEVLGRFGESELEEMRDEHGNVLVDCAFCSKQFAVRL